MVAMLNRPELPGPPGWPGLLSIPEGAQSLVVILPGGAGRAAGSRDELSDGVARACRRRGMATFRFPALFEPNDGRRPVDQGRAGRRIADVLDWAVTHRTTRDLAMGLSASGSCVAAAVIAAAVRSDQLAGLVFHAGRPDHALDCLSELEAATLFVVGSEDRHLIEVNRVAYRRLHCVRRFEILPGLSRTLKGPGAIDSVAELSASWFDVHLQGDHAS
jgi:putative phosphoribosyl transferase